MARPIFYFDVASPNAYFAHRVLPGIEARTGARFDYVPVLLGGIFKATGNQAPMITNAGVPAKMAYEHREIERFIDRHGLNKFAMNPHFPVNTLLAMRGAVAAADVGVLPAYAEAVFVAMWEEKVDCADADALGAALTRGWLDGAALLAATADPAVKARLVANTEAAVAHGAFGIPSFVVGHDLFFGKNSLPDVERAIVEH